MDPQAAWNELLDALAAEDWPIAKSQAKALRQWLDKGGFPPAVTARRGLDYLDAAMVRTACTIALKQTRKRGQQ